MSGIKEDNTYLINQVREAQMANDVSSKTYKEASSLAKEAAAARHKPSAYFAGFVMRVSRTAARGAATSC